MHILLYTRLKKIKFKVCSQYGVKYTDFWYIENDKIVENRKNIKHVKKCRNVKKPQWSKFLDKRIRLSFYPYAANRQYLYCTFKLHFRQTRPECSLGKNWEIVDESTRLKATCMSACVCVCVCFQ